MRWLDRSFRLAFALTVALSYLAALDVIDIVALVASPFASSQPLAWWLDMREDRIGTSYFTSPLYLGLFLLWLIGVALGVRFCGGLAKVGWRLKTSLAVLLPLCYILLCLGLGEISRVPRSVAAMLAIILFDLLWIVPYVLVRPDHSDGECQP